MVIGSAKGYFNIILKKMKSLDYNIRVLDVNAQDFEVPQSRHRLVFIGIRKDVFSGWKLLHPFKQIPLRQAWKGIRNSKKDLKDASYKSTVKYDHLWKYVKQGKSLKQFHPRGSYFNYLRLNINKPSKTILASSKGKLWHPVEERTLTQTELKRIATFPDDFKFSSYDDAWIGIGNSVPPNLIKNMALYALGTIKQEVMA
jgi:DNA (cytosine-5)-methyltransferase 1